MTLQEIIQLQKAFDSKHSIKFNWNEEISDDNIHQLQFLLVSLAGEVGELANVVKKIVRGDSTLKGSRGRIEDELTDVFIYVLKLSYQMKIDLEHSYKSKLDFNTKRFKPFEKNERE